jgi:hypothetical protein
MANFARLLIGIFLLPACWAVAWVFFDALLASAGASGWISAESIAVIGGLVAFSLCWMLVPRPVKAYVLAHELTHAIWGLCFGARPSDLRVGEVGGSVRLTKTNLLITLAPYFFPFYTFVVIVAALVSYAFFRPLPFLPLWMFMIGFTWAFHVLFTMETLSRRQPDITAYGRLFSWVFIFIANVAIVLVWLAVMTPLTFAQLFSFLAKRLVSVYSDIWSLLAEGWRLAAGMM